MHSIRYERSNHPLVTGNLQALMRKELYAEAQESDVVLNLVQGWSNNFYHALIEIGGRASMFIKYVMLFQGVVKYVMCCCIYFILLDILAYFLTTCEE